MKAHAWNACIGESLSRVRIPLCPPHPCREPSIGRPQARKAPSSRAIFQMPSEPRRLGDVSKAVSERLLSLITRTSHSVVRVQNGQHLQRFWPIDGPEVRGRYSTQCAVRETEMEVLARNSGRACPSGRQSPAWSTAFRLLVNRTSCVGPLRTAWQRSAFWLGHQDRFRPEADIAFSTLAGAGECSEARSRLRWGPGRLLTSLPCSLFSGG